MNNRDETKEMQEQQSSNATEENNNILEQQQPENTRKRKTSSRTILTPYQLSVMEEIAKKNHLSDSERQDDQTVPAAKIIRESTSESSNNNRKDVASNSSNEGLPGNFCFAITPNTKPLEIQGHEFRLTSQFSASSNLSSKPLPQLVSNMQNNNNNNNNNNNQTQASEIQSNNMRKYLNVEDRDKICIAYAYLKSKFPKMTHAQVSQIIAEALKIIVNPNTMGCLAISNKVFIDKKKEEYGKNNNNNVGEQLTMDNQSERQDILGRYLCLLRQRPGIIDRSAAIELNFSESYITKIRNKNREEVDKAIALGKEMEEKDILRKLSSYIQQESMKEPVEVSSVSKTNRM